MTPTVATDYFERLLEIVCPPDDTGLLVVLEAYFDESERTTGVFCVAGYAFAPAQAKKFSKEWSALFGGKVCHMTDLANRQGDFKGIQPAERDRLIREAVQIINRRMTYGVAVSCYLAEMATLSPSWIRGFRHAYPVCCHMAMSAVGKWVYESGVDHQVAYIFEDGHDHGAEARDFMRNATRDESLRTCYQYFSDAFVPKEAAVPLQAADMFAWEWAKCQDETIDQGIREIRLSLVALFKSQEHFKRYKVVHLTGPKLAGFMQQIKEIGLAQMNEDEIRKRFPHLLPPE